MSSLPSASEDLPTTASPANNQLAGTERPNDPLAADQCGPRCSDSTAEPLAGTAKQDRAYVLFEWPGGWSRDILDGGVFGSELSAALKAKFAGTATLLLIRRSDRQGRDISAGHRCFVVWPRHRGIVSMTLPGPQALLDLDLTEPAQLPVATAPLFLVCTHGKRDQCCAIKGRPIATAVAQDCVWETSHIKGHRFAPAALLLPWGYSFGRLNAHAAAQLIDYAQEGKFFLPGNRGNAAYDAPGQSAELAVAQQLIAAGEELCYDDLEVAYDAPGRLESQLRDGGGAGRAETSDAQPEIPVAQPEATTWKVHHRDGRRWLVTVERQVTRDIIASCGALPADQDSYVATAVEAIS